MIEAEPLPVKQRQDEELDCITQAPEEQGVVGTAFLEVCDNHPVHITCSVYCPDECGGHMVCDPCFQLGVRVGLIRPYGGGR